MKHQTWSALIYAMHLLMWPIHYVEQLVRYERARLKPHHARYMVGGSFMLVGSGMAFSVHEFVHMPAPFSIFCELVAAAIHAVGAVPFITPVVKKLALEDGHTPAEHPAPVFAKRMKEF